MLRCEFFATLLHAEYVLSKLCSTGVTCLRCAWQLALMFEPDLWSPCRVAVLIHPCLLCVALPCSVLLWPALPHPAQLRLLCPVLLCCACCAPSCHAAPAVPSPAMLRLLCVALLWCAYCILLVPAAL